MVTGQPFFLKGALLAAGGVHPTLHSCNQAKQQLYVRLCIHMAAATAAWARTCKCTAVLIAVSSELGRDIHCTQHKGKWVLLKEGNTIACESR